MKESPELRQLRKVKESMSKQLDELQQKAFQKKQEYNIVSCEVAK